MKYAEYKKGLELSYKFYDTIDFEPFFLNGKNIEMDAFTLINRIELYYDKQHPELLPKEMHGYFFNFVGEEEFVNYLKERYGFFVHTEIIEKHYLYYPNYNE